MSSVPRRSRIQQKNRETILEAALDVFSQQGFRGATLDQIAEGAGLSKPNLLYYFPSKEAIYGKLLEDLLEIWLQPLHDLNPQGDPLPEILAYVQRKLDLSRDMPRQSRLFANEMLQGAPRLTGILNGPLHDLVERKSGILRAWMAEGRLAPLPPRHLLFAIWSMTQHYADFEIQVRAVLGPGHDPFAEAAPFLETLFRRLLAPAPA